MARSGAVLAAVLLLLGAAGCLTDGNESDGATGSVLRYADLPVAKVTNPWYGAEGTPNTQYHQVADAPFHTLAEMEGKIAAWVKEHPELVRVEVIGQSIQGRPIWDVVLTNWTSAAAMADPGAGDHDATGGPYDARGAADRGKTRDGHQGVQGNGAAGSSEGATAAFGSAPPFDTGRVAPLIDGGHHANELGGIEIVLFTVDFLVANFERNATVRGLFDSLEMHFVPLVNPDGYVVQTRGNALGVNLNRNYDLDWGNPGGASNLLMGTLAHETGQAMPSVPIVAENSGPYAFSEPETQAMRDLMQRLADRTAFYLTGHTPTHAVIAPWAAFQPPFDVPPDHREVLEAELQWVREQTEYEAGKAEWGNLSAGLPYSASGSSMDYYYAVAKRPAFTVEVEFWYTSATSADWPMRTLEYEGLRYWMDATLPLPMHLLMNAERLAAWELPGEATLIPAGSVPEPPAIRSLHPDPPPVLH